MSVQAIPAARQVSVTATKTLAVTNPHIQWTKPATALMKPPAREAKGRNPFFPDSAVLTLPKILEDKEGMTVMDTDRLKTTALEMAMAMSLNSWPASSCTNTMGRNTATVVRVLASTAPQTSTVPS